MTPIVMLNLFNFVQFAYARHSSSKLASALAQSQISASHREPFLVILRGQILKQVQDDHQLCSVVFCYIEVHKLHKSIGQTQICSFARNHQHPLCNRNHAWTVFMPLSNE